ncbi:lipopolysaccharide biosynthesis protein [Dermatobacter hominis]|uniref:lipopolysaccharide biosynthesis protein n=1 Tax=Dermatobacter hominis TaxID=2884263 RepID=UPI001D117AFB|nr:lipopolysaccharide biosynthesis protein [Dermatobacter hominis]UDY37705.1 lipopolysaccharide biosynthesis protein [Dermatobacter hominis]
MADRPADADEETSDGGTSDGRTEAPDDGAGGDGAPGDEQSLGTTASRGFLWANVGIFTRYVSALILAAVLARVLDPADYAVMVTLMLITFYFDNALDLGMGAALVYEQEEGVSQRVQVAFTANVGLGLVLAIIAFFSAPYVADYFQQSSYVAEFRCLAIVVVLSALTTVPWSLFMRNMDFRRRAVVEVARDLSRFVVTLALALAGFGAWAIVFGLFAAYGVALIGTWAVLRFRPTFSWETSTVRQLFSYAWRVAGNRFLGLLALNGDYFIVGNRRHDQYASYYQAFRLPEFVMGAQLNGLSAVLFPMYSRIRAEGEAAIRDGMFKALRIVALFSFPVGVGLALVARDAFTVFYGFQNTAGIQTMEIISIAGAVTGLGFATGDLLMAINRPGVLLRLNAVMVPTMLVAMWFVAPQGIVWVACIHLVIQVVFVGARQLIVDRMISARTSAALSCLVPGLVVTAGILLFALPVRLMTEEGVLSLAAITGAGTLGALLALAVFPPARRELLDLVAKLRGR